MNKEVSVLANDLSIGKNKYINKYMLQVIKIKVLCSFSEEIREESGQSLYVSYSKLESLFCVLPVTRSFS